MGHSNQTIPHKKGATFGYSGAKLLPAGNWGMTSQARDKDGALVQDFATTFVLDDDYTPPEDNPDLTRYLLTIRAESDDTDAWAVGAILSCDLVFTDDSNPPVKVPTDTFVIKVVNWVTHGV